MDDAAIIFGSFDGNSVYGYAHLGSTGYCDAYLGEKEVFIYYYL